MQPLQQCKLCQLLKPRAILLRNPGHYVYADAEGRRWKGHICPDCASTAKPKLNQLTKRRCRRCDKLLNSSRYFNCEACVMIGTENAEYDHTQYQGGVRWSA